MAGGAGIASAVTSGASIVSSSASLINAFSGGGGGGSFAPPSIGSTIKSIAKPFTQVVNTAARGMLTKVAADSAELSGEMTESLAGFNADELRRKGKIEMDNARINANIQLRADNAVLAHERAGAGARGITKTGTFLVHYEKNVRDANLNYGITLRGGVLKQDDLNQLAAIKDFEGTTAKLGGEVEASTIYARAALDEANALSKANFEENLVDAIKDSRTIINTGAGGQIRESLGGRFGLPDFDEDDSPIDFDLSNSLGFFVTEAEAARTIGLSGAEIKDNPALILSGAFE